jgi:hypothetical protein
MTPIFRFRQQLFVFKIDLFVKLID